ncbi:MAG: hypothetical protein JOZ72_08275 [Alphaproteobacteria bacterium]|nr:hypothetical protein [Alphaproteobacteria bacterium]
MKALYAICAAACLLAMPASAGERVLYGFTQNAEPNGPLVRDAQGNVYGTTRLGGAYGRGSVFRLDRDGALHVLHDFTGAGDGANPDTGLARDAQGNLYGTASVGGPLVDSRPFVGGTVFKVAADGTFGVLHRFGDGRDGDGSFPVSTPWRDAGGNLYGTTARGGDPACRFGCGTVFKIAADGSYSQVYRFRGIDGDGAGPFGGVIGDAAGNLYGTTMGGGVRDHGTVYRIAPDGQETVLAVFGKGPNRPAYGLAADASGNLYGVTINGKGSVFRVTPKGHKTILHEFKWFKEGLNPSATPIVDAQGNLYGTTSRLAHGRDAGNDCCGAVFAMAPDGTTTVLHRFQGGTDGATPIGGLVMDDTGVLYGATYRGGGTANGGTVFSLKTNGRR